MATRRSSDPTAQAPIFPIALGVLGATALAQVWIAALALAERWEEGREVRIVEREVPRIVTVSVPAAAPEPAAPADQLPPPALALEEPPAPAPATPPAIPQHVSPRPVNHPPIADPVVERLVTEARAARVGNDMGAAILKLREALTRDEGEPSAHFEMGLVHEAMGVYDTAAEHYERVYVLGLSRAGALYEMAAAKLRDGLHPPAAPIGELSFGRIVEFRDPEHEHGERVTLTIPVQKAPSIEISADDFYISVLIFNRDERGEIVADDNPAHQQQRWTSLPIDWQGGEEILRIDYQMPARSGNLGHLFEGMRYFGYVVTLHYGEEVIDVEAEPRGLIARMPQLGAADPGGSLLPDFSDLELLLPPLDPDQPLLLPR